MWKSLWHLEFGHVLRATTAYTFSTSQLSIVVQGWCALYFLTWKRASRHNGVQLFTSPDGSAPVESLEKHRVSRLCFLFTNLHPFSSNLSPSLIFSLLLFSSLTLPGPSCWKFDFYVRSLVIYSFAWPVTCICRHFT